jgi:hypothetical protein
MRRGENVGTVSVWFGNILGLRNQLGLALRTRLGGWDLPAWKSAGCGKKLGWIVILRGVRELMGDASLNLVGTVILILWSMEWRRVTGVGAEERLDSAINRPASRSSRYSRCPSSEAGSLS